MTFTETSLPGVIIVDADTFVDTRGHFASVWIRGEFEARGLETNMMQCSIAANRKRGTIRGLHYQRAPYAQDKLVRVIRGSVFDVAVDLRPGSATRRQWIGLELSAESPRMLYIPKGFAHGYQTLTDDAEVLYFISSQYAPDHQGGIRWDDPALAIDWPLGRPAVISERDARYPDFQT